MDPPISAEGLPDYTTTDLTTEIIPTGDKMDGQVPFKQHIDIQAPAAASHGMDPALTSLLMNQGKTEGMSAAEMSLLTNGNNSGGFGGGMGGILPLLLLGLIGGGRGGLFGGHGDGGHHESPAQTLLEANVTGTPDIMAAINSGNLASATGFSTVSRDVLMAQNQGFQNLVTEINDTQGHIVDAINLNARDLAGGFAAGQLSQCQTQNLVNTTSAQVAASAALGQCRTENLINTTASSTQLQALQNKFELSTQLAECCCAQKIATLGVLKAITDDGQTTRALITSNRIDDLQAQLNDAKSAVRDQGIINAIFGTPVVGKAIAAKVA